ncbi:MAG TPA: transporter substrate-binding domain-containing protein [Thermoanaerobaculia bacterium]|nr:transporter substrate-binding domain-containing protein [Thermoanaerobaculia bacterium]
MSAAAVAQPTAASVSEPPAALRGDSWAATQRAGRGTLTLVYYYPLEGFAYLDGSGKVSGVMIELMDQFKSYLKNVRNVDVTYRHVPYDDFPRFYAAVREGQGGVIGLAGTTITEERKKEVTFGPPFFSSMPVLVTNAAVPDVTSRERVPAELAGFTALAFRGTTLDALTRRLKAERWPALTVESVPTFHEITDRLSRDPKAFAFLDLNVFWVQRKAGARIKRHRAADGPHEEFGFTMPLGSDWAAPLADFFASGGGYRNSRAYRQLLIKHLGVDLKELFEVTGR